MERSSTLRHGTIRPPLRLAEPPVDPRERVEELVRRLHEQEAARATSRDEERSHAWLDALRSAEERAQRLADEVEQARGELGGVRVALAEPHIASSGRAIARPLLAPLDLDFVLRGSVLILLAGLFGMTVWAGVRDYALRVTSDTPTFLALVTGMAQRPFAEQSPFLAQQVATQHATPYMQAVAFLWSFLGGGERDPVSAARLLALVGIPVFALLLWSVFLYARRVAGSRAAWISLPVLLGLFGPPHVIWASDQSLHGALYASYFPQNLALATLLLTLLALERDGYPMLVLACLGAATTMIVHPFSGVLLCILATVQGCYAALRREHGYYRAPVALIAGFALGMTWPAYSLDRAFAETGMPGVLFVSLCAGLVFAVHRLARVKQATHAPRALSGLLERLTTKSAVFRLAIAGAVGTAIVVVWELALVHSPPEESARLAIYWVDDRWRWPLLLVAGTVGLSGLAWLARRGSIVPAFWLAGCLALGLMGVVGLPIPVWYRFLLLCQIPLAIGVAAVLAHVGSTRTLAIVMATFALAIGVKVATLLEAPPSVSYFGSELQAVWKLGEHVPPGPGLVATDPKTSYFVPAATGHRVLTLDKAHASSHLELAFAEDGYRLLRRYYAGGRTWWQAGQEMWRRGVRYVIVEKHTTLAPKTLAGFTWQSSMLTTNTQRRGLSRYFYENNRAGDLVYDSPDYAVYRLNPRKLLVRGASDTRATRGP